MFLSPELVWRSPGLLGLAVFLAARMIFCLFVLRSQTEGNDMNRAIWVDWRADKREEETTAGKE